jgi:Protein of unknown function (DUF2889)
VTVLVPLRDLHPRHGIHEPTSGTPPRLPGSARRTTTIDMLRPAGPHGPLELAGRGRDLLTGSGGAGRELASASCHAVIDFLGGRLLTELSTSPGRPLDGLLGTRVSSGFRGRLDATDPSLNTDDTLLYQLLDDFPVATLVSGHAVGAALEPGQELPPMAGRPGFMPDMCAGFATGGTIMNGIGADGRPPVVTGPGAPSLADGADPAAWHATTPLPPGSMRRARRIDVRPMPDVAPGAAAGRPVTSAPAMVDAMFRDSYVLPDGTETIIHEYTLTARIDDGTVMTCAARPRVLPWVECPAAAASAARLAGQPLRSLRSHVHASFSGTSTCTHLNDMLRALADVPVLLELAAAGD